MLGVDGISNNQCLSGKTWLEEVIKINRFMADQDRKFETYINEFMILHRAGTFTSLHKEIAESRGIAELSNPVYRQSRNQDGQTPLQFAISMKAYIYIKGMPTTNNDRLDKIIQLLKEPVVHAPEHQSTPAASVSTITEVKFIEPVKEEPKIT